MSCSDALISDYSSVACDYLHLNRMIAYTIDDLNEYNLDFIVDDPTELMAGPTIKDIGDLYKFVEDIVYERDVYRTRRNEVFDKIYKYRDGSSCKRLFDHMLSELNEN